jgi:hypothetical protein
MSRPNYPRSRAVCIDTDDLDERYRLARQRVFRPFMPARLNWWSRLWGLQ